jgi:hypothetical protein
MDRIEFEELRDLSDKTIVSDIEFLPSKSVSTTLTFEVPVSNSTGYDLILNGSYMPDIPKLKLNFSIKGIGPICRIEVNGPLHRDAGRTHKHELHHESCPRQNLPNAIARPDLDLSRLSPKDIWSLLCEEANIVHVGVFKEPWEDHVS